MPECKADRPLRPEATLPGRRGSQRTVQRRNRACIVVPGCKKEVPWGGLEPPTRRLEGGCSIHLSYQGSGDVGGQPTARPRRREARPGAIREPSWAISGDVSGPGTAPRPAASPRGAAVASRMGRRGGGRARVPFRGPERAFLRRVSNGIAARTVSTVHADSGRLPASFASACAGWERLRPSGGLHGRWTVRRSPTLFYAAILALAVLFSPSALFAQC